MWQCSIEIYYSALDKNELVQSQYQTLACGTETRVVRPWSFPNIVRKYECYLLVVGVGTPTEVHWPWGVTECACYTISAQYVC